MYVPFSCPAPPSLLPIYTCLAQTRNSSCPYLYFVWQDPHIVTVPTTLPFHGGFDYEHKGTPFEDYEVRSLQYVTLVGETDRDTARPWPAAEWMDVIEARSPASIAARSHTTTPNAAAALAAKENKVPKTKISFGDYKNLKKTGAKASPNPATAKGLGHARNLSGGEPLSRDNSFEGQNGNSSFSSNKGAVKDVPRYVFWTSRDLIMLISSLQTCSACFRPKQCKDASCRSYKRTYAYL